MLRRLRDQALVMERRELGEADRLVVLLCRDHGKVGAVAHSGRRSRRRFGGCLDLFVRIDVQLVDKGRGGLWRLEEAVLIYAHPGIRTDLVSIAHAGYATELVSALLREGEEASGASEAFDLLLRALESLDRGPCTAAGLRRFELDLLTLSGLAPSLGACVSCGTESAQRWSFDHDQGGLVCRSCGPGPRSEELTDTTLDLLRRLQAGQEPARPDPAGMSFARSLLARVIDQHVGRPLKAREFLRNMAMERRDDRPGT